MKSNASAAVTRNFDNWPRVREVILFLAGLGGVLYETFHGPVEPSLLVIFGAMMGIPIILNKDNKEK